MAIKVQGSTVVYDDRKFNIKTGTTSQRPASPADGTLWYNTDLASAERYSTTSGWASLSGTGLTGQVNYFGQDPGSSWVLANGSVALQSSYPGAYGQLGSIANQNLTTWTARTSATDTAIRAITYGNGLYVYGGAGGNLATSTDAITWTIRTSGTTTQINALTYGNGLFVYGALSGTIGTSTDAITWTIRTSGTTSAIQALTYGNGLFVYGVDTGAIRTSTDGITWTARTSGAPAIQSLAYGNGLYVCAQAVPVVTTYSNIGTSTNGITWTTRTVAATTVSYVVYGAGLFVGVSSGNDTAAYSSTNGITWTQRYTSANASGTVGYGNGLFILPMQSSATILATSTPITYNINTEFYIPNFAPLVTGVTDNSNYFYPYIKN